MSDETALPATGPPEPRFAELPERVDPADYVELVDTTEARDPDGGRDPDTEWMLKHA